MAARGNARRRGALLGLLVLAATSQPLGDRSGGMQVTSMKGGVVRKCSQHGTA